MEFLQQLYWKFCKAIWNCLKYYWYIVEFNSYVICLITGMRLCVMRSPIGFDTHTERKNMPWWCIEYLN